MGTGEKKEEKRKRKERRTHQREHETPTPKAQKCLSDRSVDTGGSFDGACGLGGREKIID